MNQQVTTPPLITQEEFDRKMREINEEQTIVSEPLKTRIAELTRAMKANGLEMARLLEERRQIRMERDNYVRQLKTIGGIYHERKHRFIADHPKP